MSDYDLNAALIHAKIEWAGFNNWGAYSNCFKALEHLDPVDQTWANDTCPCIFVSRHNMEVVIYIPWDRNGANFDPDYDLSNFMILLPTDEYQGKLQANADNYAEFETAQEVADALQKLFAPEYALAVHFISEMRNSLNLEELREVVEKNRGRIYYGCCASHEYLDANEVMMAAFMRAFSREPLMDDGPNDPIDLQTINRAWELAKAADFDFTKLYGTE